MLLSEYFSRFPDRHATVVSEDAVSRASFLRKPLPGAEGSEFIFECELRWPEVTGDFSLCVTRRELPRWLTALESESFLSWSGDSAPWARVREFFSQWASNATFRPIGEFWFEFDYETLAADRPAPCCFFDAGAIKDPEELNGVRDALSALLGRAIPRVFENLKRCVKALPAGTGLYQIGAMLGRDENPRSVRLFTDGMRAEKVLPFLRSAGWDSRASEPALEEFLLWSMPYLSGFHIIDFDVNEEGISQKIGVNFGVDPCRTREFLDALFERGLIFASKNDGVKAWLELDDIPPLKNDISHFKFPIVRSLLGPKAYLRHDARQNLFQNLARW